MTRKDIDRIYTEKVAELLAQGYQIHTGSMGGSQGEIAHTDFIKGSEILRLLLEQGSDYHSACGDSTASAWEGTPSRCAEGTPTSGITALRHSLKSSWPR